MRFPKRPTADDVDVESCLENLDRVEEVGEPTVVLDLTAPTQPEDEVVETGARPPQSLSRGAGDPH